MQKVATLLCCSIILLISSCSNLMFPQETTRSENFSFVYRHTPCGSVPIDAFDSSKNILIHTPLNEAESTTLALQLTVAELDAIYQKAIEVDYFNLPTKLIPPDNLIHIIAAPAGTYELDMTNGEMVNIVYWKSDIITEPLFEQANDFLNLMLFIGEIIRSHEEYKQLPESRAGCV